MPYGNFFFLAPTRRGPRPVFRQIPKTWLPRPPPRQSTTY
jgi:hypothetical protein